MQIIIESLSEESFIVKTPQPSIIGYMMHYFSTDFVHHVMVILGYVYDVNGLNFCLLHSKREWVKNCIYHNLRDCKYGVHF